MDEQRLAELERLANQTTPGPWHYKEGLMFKHYVYSDNEDLKVSCAPLELSFQEFSSYDGRDVPGKENAQFIAASREAIPELIAEIRRLQSELANAATHAEVQAGQAYEAGFSAGIIAYLNKAIPLVRSYNEPGISLEVQRHRIVGLLSTLEWPEAKKQAQQAGKE